MKRARSHLHLAASAPMLRTLSTLSNYSLLRHSLLSPLSYLIFLFSYFPPSTTTSRKSPSRGPLIAHRRPHSYHSLLLPQSPPLSPAFAAQCLRRIATFRSHHPSSSAVQPHLALNLIATINGLSYRSYPHNSSYAPRPRIDHNLLAPSVRPAVRPFSHSWMNPHSLPCRQKAKPFLPK